MEDISVITAVHHPLRRRIFDYLLLYGTAQVTVISRALDCQVGSTSHHLRMLERAGVVERAEDPSKDGRTSWWQLARRGMTWSADDFVDSPGDALLAREAERQGVRLQIERLQSWRRQRGEARFADYDAFNTETTAWASPDELRDLAARLRQMLSEWADTIDTGDDTKRVPIFFFSHAFPMEP